MAKKINLEIATFLDWKEHYFENGNLAPNYLYILYIYIYKHRYITLYMYTCIYKFISICTYICIYMYMYMYIFNKIPTDILAVFFEETASYFQNLNRNQSGLEKLKQ
jgi:hypothetical protein